MTEESGAGRPSPEKDKSAEGAPESASSSKSASDEGSAVEKQSAPEQPLTGEKAPSAQAQAAPPPEGLADWYPDPYGGSGLRYWDGSEWTGHTHGGTQAAGAVVSTEKKSSDERKALLAQQLQTASARGRRIESQSDFQAVLIEGKVVNHTVHLIATLATCGLWGIVWLVMALTGGEKREMVAVDEFGNVQYQRMGKA